MASLVEAAAGASAARRTSSRSASSVLTSLYLSASQARGSADALGGGCAGWPVAGDPAERQQRAVRALEEALDATRDARRAAAETAAGRNGPPV